MYFHYGYTSVQDKGVQTSEEEEFVGDTIIGDPGCFKEGTGRFRTEKAFQTNVEKDGKQKREVLNKLERGGSNAKKRLPMIGEKEEESSAKVSIPLEFALPMIRSTPIRKEEMKRTLPAIRIPPITKMREKKFAPATILSSLRIRTAKKDDAVEKILKEMKVPSVVSFWDSTNNSKKEEEDKRDDEKPKITNVINIPRNERYQQEKSKKNRPRNVLLSLDFEKE